MPREKTNRSSLSVGQLAKRWGVSPDRVRGLVQAGQIPGAFRIPSAGRFGSTIKIPLSVVVELESDWTVQGAKQKKRRSPNSILELRHLKSLTTDLESDAECPGAGHD